MILPLTKNFPRLMEKTRVMMMMIRLTRNGARPTLTRKMTLLKKN